MLEIYHHVFSSSVNAGATDQNSVPLHSLTLCNCFVLSTQEIPICVSSVFTVIHSLHGGLRCENGKEEITV